MRETVKKLKFKTSMRVTIFGQPRIEKRIRNFGSKISFNLDTWPAYISQKSSRCTVYTIELSGTEQSLYVYFKINPVFMFRINPVYEQVCDDLPGGRFNPSRWFSNASHPHLRIHTDVLSYWVRS